MRFDATAARAQSDIDRGHQNATPESVAYYGIYLRINKNRVLAFQGPGLSPSGWDKVFAHYFNLLCAIELCRLVQWLESRQASLALDLSGFASTFGIRECARSEQLLPALTEALVALELYVNNPSRLELPILSIAEAPLRSFVETVGNHPPLQGRHIFCCIDEYENLLDSQQALVNTYIKHSEPPLSYKIGIKRGGLRSRATIDTTDVLSTPDDYVAIDIAEESFELFARQVVEHRLGLARSRGINVAETLDEFLPELPFAREAELLDCKRIADEVKANILSSKDTVLVEWAERMPATEIYFLKYWSEGTSESITALAGSWMSDPDAWATRLGNYGYASLFWLSKGRKGARIRKYYAGARTLVALASGNIRYFLELIDESLSELTADVNGNFMNVSSVPSKHQTLAARTVGKRRLDQLDGLTDHGSEIKRLVLALGKVFFEFARDPVGKSPERNSFVVTGGADARDRVLTLLNEGVANLAFEATPRTKATSQHEMRDDEFRLHPIFAPFFEYSHRRKRRSTFAAETLLEVLTNPSRALGALLGRQPASVDELPQQMAMFSAFYESSDAPE